MIYLIRWANTFPNWTTYNVIFDSSVSRSVESDIYDILHTENISLTMLRLSDDNSYNNIRSFMAELPVRYIHGRFLICVGKDMALNIVKAVSSIMTVRMSSSLYLTDHRAWVS